MYTLARSYSVCILNIAYGGPRAATIRVLREDCQSFSSLENMGFSLETR